MSFYTSPVLEPKVWQPLWSTFPGEYQEMTRELFPGVEVNRDKVRNRPTPADPLGAQPALVTEWLQPRGMLDLWQGRVKVFGDDSMPFLEPEAAAAYLVVQWPELFRRRS